MDIPRIFTISESEHRIHNDTAGYVVDEKCDVAG